MQLPPLNKNLEMGSGRFGVLYSDPRDPTRCIKKLKSPYRGKEAENLRRLVDIARWARPSDVHHLLTRFAWPIEVFGEPDEVVAFTMPKAPQSCYFDLTIVSRIADRSKQGVVTETKKNRRDPLQLKYLIDNTWWQGRQVGSQKPNVSLEDRIEIAIDCCDSVSVLHSHGLVYGDISANNIVARLDSTNGSYFFDADSISTAEFRAADPLVSPGWETPSDLDPFAIDRSRCALVVLRLLTEVPNARPDDGALSAAPATISILKPLLERTFQVGDEPSFLALITGLRSLRPMSSADRAMDEALKTGYARLVMRERIHARSSSHRILLQQAENQVVFESQVDQATGLEHRRLVRRSRVRVGQFKLDVSPRFGLTQEIRSMTDLMGLIYEAQFVEIASHLVSTGLGSLEAHPTVKRVIDHAHLEVNLPTPVITSEPGSATISLTWPIPEFVNCAHLRIRVGIDQQDFAVVRNRGDHGFKRVVSAPRGADIQITVVFGSRSKGGRDFFPNFKRTVSHSIPAIPIPKAPVHSNQRNLSHANTPVASSFTVVDPELEQLVRERQELQRRRRRTKMIMGVLLTLTLTISGLVAYRVSRPQSQLVALSRDQLSDTPLNWAQETFGAPLVSTSRDSSSITISWVRSRQAPLYNIQFSFDGERWTRPTTIDPTTTVGWYVSNFVVGGIPPLMLVEASDSRGGVIGRQFINVLHATGFARYPRFTFSPTEITVIAPPASLSGERVPRAVLVETTSLDSTGRQVVSLSRMPGSQTTVPRERYREVIRLRVKAVFGPGDSGPFFGIDL